MNKLAYGLFITLFFSFSSVRAEVTAESMIQVLHRLEILEKTIRELRGENEVLNHQIQSLKKNQKEGFLSIDKRLDAVRNNRSVQVSQRTHTPTSPNNHPNVRIVNKPKVPLVKSAKQKQSSHGSPTAIKKEPVANQKKPRVPTGYEKEVYQSAFALMKKSPSAATKAFREYIKLQPNSPLAANAQYWIGEIMYSHNNYKGAVQEFIQVLQKYKYSDKAPDAAIKLGYSFYALKNWAFARRTFEDILRFFPKNKNAVRLAERRLEKMKAAGH